MRVNRRYLRKWLSPLPKFNRQAIATRVVATRNAHDVTETHAKNGQVLNAHAYMDVENIDGHSASMNT